MAEPRDIDLRGVFAGAAVVLGGIVLSIAVSWAILAASDAPAEGPNAAAAPKVSGPALQTAPQRTLAEFVREKNARLESSGAVEGEPGRVHIPIEQAMQLLVQRQAK
ncbi:MAG: hypothetical protein EPO20_17600 [Betaproteobacteria bacterium]|nr:MAG: hypothetical protein EPO20_17600 [Betaproteobacteria bacterium]